MSNLMNLNEIKPNPDGNDERKICKSCPYNILSGDRCLMIPSKFLRNYEVCGYFKGYKRIEQQEKEEELEGKVIDYNKDTFWECLTKLWSKK